MDETWLHYYTPESKRQSAEWTAVGEPNPKRAKTKQSAGKVMASVFWDANGIIFIDYLQKGTTIVVTETEAYFDEKEKSYYKVGKSLYSLYRPRRQLC